MILTAALRLKPGDLIAFAGAGGKTSAMFALAQELEKPVILSTTTHMGAWQAALADSHLIIHEPRDLKLLQINDKGTILLTGPAGGDDRLSGLDEILMDELGDFCQQRGLTLLVEADGARQRPLKAPAEYEPVIPGFVTKVVVLAGLSGLDKPLIDDFVHRPDRFSEVCGLPVGNRIGVDDLLGVLSSEKGGLKNIPDGAIKLLFLNQSDDPILAAKGNKLANKLLNHYDRVLIGSLHRPGQEGVIFGVHTQTAGVILAAGGSERYGESKQLLDWDGMPFIVRVVQAAFQAGLDPITVITGAEHEKIKLALRDFPVRIIFNPDWKEGQSKSVIKGIQTLPERCDNVVFLLSDQPQVSPLLIRALIESRAQKHSIVTVPMAGGKRANPVLFGSEAFEILKTVTGDQGGRAVFNQFKVEWLPWVDSRIQMDVDEPGDEKALFQAYFVKKD